MYKLFYFFMDLSSKETYTVINVIDIVDYLVILFGLLGSIIVLHNDELLRVLEVVTLILSVIALFVYLKESRYRTGIHKAYMITRLFCKILQFIMITRILFILISKKRVRGEPIFIVIRFLWDLLNLYWSYLLFKVVT